MVRSIPAENVADRLLDRDSLKHLFERDVRAGAEQFVTLQFSPDKFRRVYTAKQLSFLASIPQFLRMFRRKSL